MENFVVFFKIAITLTNNLGDLHIFFLKKSIKVM